MNKIILRLKFAYGMLWYYPFKWWKYGSWGFWFVTRQYAQAVASERKLLFGSEK